MKEKLENKIDAIIDFILNKPEEKITQEDYNILTSELRDLRFRESEVDSRKRMEQLFSIVYPGFSACGDVK